MNSTDKLNLKLKNCIKEEDYYEATQLYKTLFRRYILKKDIHMAHSILKEGSVLLLGHNEIISGTELGLQLLTFFSDQKLSVNDKTLNSVVEIIKEYPRPPTQKNDSSLIVQKRSFIAAALKWSITYGPNKLGEPIIHGLYAEFLDEINEISLSQTHFVKSNDVQRFSITLLRWANQGYPSERDLFLARAIFLYLGLENLKDANAIYDIFMNNYYKDIEEIRNSPLVHFLEFLLKTLEYDAYPIFQELYSKYSFSIDRDPMFKVYLDQISQVFFKKPIATSSSSSSSSPPSSTTNQSSSSTTTNQSSSSDPFGALFQSLFSNINGN